MSKLVREAVWASPQHLMEAARMAQIPYEKMQVARRQTGFTYSEGPMFYLGQQIVKAMEDAGRPAKIVECYRPPERQAELYAKGRTAAGSKVTNAPPWHSPHQFYEAVDIIHPAHGWQVSEEYWETLAACCRTVGEKYGVKLNHGHTWRFRDSAHIEMPDWRFVQARHMETLEKLDRELPKLPQYEAERNRPPNKAELWARFNHVLPDIAKRVVADGRAPCSIDFWQSIKSILSRLGLT